MECLTYVRPEIKGREAYEELADEFIEYSEEG